MKKRVLIILVSVVLTNMIVACGSNSGSSSDTVEATKPVVSNPRHTLNHYGSFESFSIKTSSEHYQLVSLGNKTVGEKKPTSNNNQLEDPLSNLMRGVQ